LAKKQIPDDVRAQVEAIVEQFDKKELRGRRCFYIARCRGSYLYLDRNDWGRVSHVCRLEYNGAIERERPTLVGYESVTSWLRKIVTRLRLIRANAFFDRYLNATIKSPA
jgi:hypothetical protein